MERLVKDRVEEVLAAFGKLGLLIEDAPDARLRTARELYGTDGLPEWWLHFGNLEDGTRALRAALRATVTRKTGWAYGLPVLIVLDRYLKESQASPRLMAWDENEHQEFVDLVRALQAAGRELPVTLVPVTSYSGPSHWAGEKVVQWQPRHHEPLYQTRGHLYQDGSRRPLLHFGPTERAPVTSSAPKSVFADAKEQKVAICRARYWQRGIAAIKEALASADLGVACVLLTGAGASLANDPLAPGIPATWHLLERACWEVTGRPKERKPTWPMEENENSLSLPLQEVETLNELQEKYESGVSVRNLSWSLEKLFERKLQERDRLVEFGAAFRQSLQLWDHDFPYHFWLLAQLPWTLILTTNFDRFHERAAANAAAVAGDAHETDRVRRLGDVVPMPDFLDAAESKTINNPSGRRSRSGRNRWAALSKGPGLLKPFGSLMTVGHLALTHRDFWHRLSWASNGSLQPILSTCRECWLVIVGHRLRSDAFHHSLRGLLQRYGKKIRLVWVEPYPYHNNLGDFDTSRSFKAMLDNAGRYPDDPFGMKPSTCVLPGKALEFCFDLWLEWRHPRSMRR